MHGTADTTVHVAIYVPSASAYNSTKAVNKTTYRITCVRLAGGNLLGNISLQLRIEN